MTASSRVGPKGADDMRVTIVAAVGGYFATRIGCCWKRICKAQTAAIGNCCAVAVVTALLETLANDVHRHAAEFEHPQRISDAAPDPETQVQSMPEFFLGSTPSPGCASALLA
jgi:hypothetical protein